MPIFQDVIPLADQQSIRVELEAGSILFLIGENGAGKSSLLTRFSLSNPTNVRRVWASRSNLFQQENPSLSPPPSPAEQASQWHGQRATLTGKDVWWQQSSDFAITRLLMAETNFLHGTRVRAETKSPFATTNEVLLSAGFKLKLSQHDLKVLVSRSGSESFAMSQLSDGERNAILLVADCITAPFGTLLLIDEPEKNLYRRISSQLITDLVEQLPDCAVVISTHDPSLIPEIKASSKRIFLVRNISFTLGSVQHWEIDDVKNPEEIQPDLFFEILGPKRKLLFVEGELDSPDLKIYSAIFGDTVEVKRIADRRQVEKFVGAITKVTNMTWIECSGITDRDFTTTAEPNNNVTPIKIYSIDSLFCLPEMYSALIREQAETLDKDKEWIKLRLNQANSKSKEVLTKKKVDLTTKRWQMDQRERLNRLIQKTEPTNGVITLTDDATTDIQKLLTDYEQALQNDDLNTLARDYPMKKTGLIHELAMIAECKDVKQYVERFAKLIKTNHTFRTQVIKQLGLENHKFILN
jgi:ABC-type ATPase involved in cell division